MWDRKIHHKVNKRCVLLCFQAHLCTVAFSWTQGHELLPSSSASSWAPHSPKQAHPSRKSSSRTSNALVASARYVKLGGRGPPRLHFRCHGPVEGPPHSCSESQGIGYGAEPDDISTRSWVRVSDTRTKKLVEVDNATISEGPRKVRRIKVAPESTSASNNVMGRTRAQLWYRKIRSSEKRHTPVCIYLSTAPPRIVFFLYPLGDSGTLPASGKQPAAQ